MGYAQLVKLSNEQLLNCVLQRVPGIDPETALELIASCDADLSRVYRLLGVNASGSKRQLTFGVKKAAPVAERKLGSIQTGIVNLYTPDQVSAAGIYCSIQLNVLELSEANTLFSELLSHSEQWRRDTFYLFDKLAHQGQSSALFTRDSTLQGEAPSLSGVTRLDSYPYSVLLEKAAKTVERLVKENVNGDIQDWNANVAIANRYNGRSDSVGWHSDSLSHIGPEPTIAGLSLGCTREFRLRRRSKDASKVIYSIHAPHNSLIIMHPGCQELFTHTIARAQALTRHPLAGDVRISMTYRHYRKEYQDSALPKCKCGCPMILRTTLEGDYNYIWQCGASYSKSGGCRETRKASFGLPRRSVR